MRNLRRRAMIANMNAEKIILNPMMGWQISHNVLVVEQLRKKCIVQNICPSCNGMLKECKRTKLNNYKREWTCLICFEIHNI